MIFQYKEYLKENKSLTVEQMIKLHEELIEEIGTDEDAMELYEELIKAATSYAAMRAEWFQMSRADRMEKDPIRTSHHNFVIIHFNMLSRYLRMQGKKAEWRDMLGYEEEDGYNRKRIGDFACYIVFVNSICAR